MTDIPAAVEWSVALAALVIMGRFGIDLIEKVRALLTEKSSGNPYRNGGGVPLNGGFTHADREDLHVVKVATVQTLDRLANHEREEGKVFQAIVHNMEANTRMLEKILDRTDRIQQ